MCATLFQPNFGDVLLGLDCRMLGSEERRPQANYSSNYFRTNPTYTTTVHQRHRRTDGRTDDLRQQYRALHYVYRAVKRQLFDNCVNVKEQDEKRVCLLAH